MKRMQRHLLINRLAVGAALIRLQRIAEAAIGVLEGVQRSANRLGCRALEQVRKLPPFQQSRVRHMNSSARARIVGSDIGHSFA